MRVSYNKLWKLLIDKGMKKMDLLEAIEMSPNTLAKLGRNEDMFKKIGENKFHITAEESPEATIWLK